MGDLQLKIDLRKELVVLERFLKLAKEDKKEELIEEIETEINRVKENLQD